MQTDFQFTTLTLACPQFLCHKPIASYTRNGQKISFCRRCKGIIIRTLVEFDFDLSSPAPASKSNTTTTTTTTSTISVQDWLWHLCDLRLYLELERFRLGFEEMIRHIRRELKRNSNNKYAVVEAKAVPGGEWTDHPLAAYVCLTVAVPAQLAKSVGSASSALQEHEAKLATATADALASAAALAQSDALEHLMGMTSIGQR
ncbi:hypothetical protein LY78DRAFT_683987 [Colletotrichum sublineola]|nr:hypothetical protein LY78DRAFT_683987 [Colletotrichum sublineola]